MVNSPPLQFPPLNKYTTSSCHVGRQILNAALYPPEYFPFSTEKIFASKLCNCKEQKNINFETNYRRKKREIDKQKDNNQQNESAKHLPRMRL